MCNRDADPRLGREIGTICVGLLGAYGITSILDPVTNPYTIHKPEIYALAFTGIAILLITILLGFSASKRWNFLVIEILFYLFAMIWAAELSVFGIDFLVSAYQVSFEMFWLILLLVAGVPTFLLASVTYRFIREVFGWYAQLKRKKL